MSIYITIGFRIVTIMMVLLISTIIISGRRTIGQLPVFDFLTIIVIGAITGADIAEPDIPHFHIIFAIIVTYLFQKIINIIYIKSSVFRQLTTFPPIVILQDGMLSYKNIKKVNYSVDEVLMLLRQNDIFDISHIKYAVLEPDGELSIFKKDEHQHITRKDMSITCTPSDIYYTVIMDGKIEEHNLSKIPITTKDIHGVVSAHGYSNINDIFYCAIDRYKNVVITPYDYSVDDI